MNDSGSEAQVRTGGHMANGITEAEWIWVDGELVPWRDATVHVLSLAVQFGSSVFEGIRCYRTPRGPAVFRLHDHLRRLYDSCRVYRMTPRFSPEQLAQACLTTIAHNRLEACYVRPMVLRGYGDAGMMPSVSPIQTYVACWPWGAYLGTDALSRGVDVCVSNWQRAAPNTYPSLVKSAGHYNNAQLIKMQAAADSYAEAIALGTDGLVSEGSGQNVFVVRDGVIVTPPVAGSILSGITRNSILAIAADLEIPVAEQAIQREALYSADELFFTGTASEVTPIRSVDRIPIGGGSAGPITLRLQRRFMQIVGGETGDDRGWLTHVAPAEAGAMATR